MNDYVDLIKSLCRTWTKMEKARSEALRANDPKEILRGHWPAVQGFDIRMAIMKLGKSEADTNAAAKLLLALADNE